MVDCLLSTALFIKIRVIIRGVVHVCVGGGEHDGVNISVQFDIFWNPRQVSWTSGLVSWVNCSLSWISFDANIDLLTLIDSMVCS